MAVFPFLCHNRVPLPPKPFHLTQPPLASPLTVPTNPPIFRPVHVLVIALPSEGPKNWPISSSPVESWRPGLPAVYRWSIGNNDWKFQLEIAVDFASCTKTSANHSLWSWVAGMQRMDKPHISSICVRILRCFSKHERQQIWRLSWKCWTILLPESVDSKFRNLSFRDRKSVV